MASIAQSNRKLPLHWPRLAMACANLQCPRHESLWSRLLRRKSTVKFHSSTFCFPHCFERELTQRLERLSTPTPSAPARPRRIPLGLLMLSRGTLTNQQLRRALEEKHLSTLRIGERLTRMGFTRDRDIAAALAMQWSCPLVRQLPRARNMYGIPGHLLLAFRMFPFHVSKAAAVLHIAFADEIPYAALVAIEQMLQLKTQACLTTPRELDSALVRLEESKQPREKLIDNVRGPDEIVRIVSDYAGGLKTTEVRVVRCGAFFWARILAEPHPTDLIFSRMRLHFDQDSPGATTYGREHSLIEFPLHR